jgi:hypothetical protein
MEPYLHFPNTPPWCGAHLKEAQGQLYFTLLYHPGIRSYRTYAVEKRYVINPESMNKPIEFQTLTHKADNCIPAAKQNERP